jgi:hypothetical protein
MMVNPAEFQDFQERSSRRGPGALIVFALSLTVPILIMRLWNTIQRRRNPAAFEQEYEEGWEEPQRKARALYDFKGETEQDLSFSTGDTIVVLGQPFPDWWEGELNGRRGLFPANFVEELREGPGGPPPRR